LKSATFASTSARELADNGHQHVDGHGDPDLILDCVLAGRVESFDSEVLLDPLKNFFTEKK
jgi:hypothetical protein